MASDELPPRRSSQTRQVSTWVPPGRDLRKGARAVVAAAGGRYGPIGSESPEKRQAQERSAVLSEDPKLREMKHHIGLHARNSWPSATPEESVARRLQAKPGNSGGVANGSVASAAVTQASGLLGGTQVGNATASSIGRTLRGTLRMCGTSGDRGATTQLQGGFVENVGAGGGAASTGIGVSGWGGATSSTRGIGRSASQPEIDMIKSYLSMTRATGTGGFVPMETVDNMLEQLEEAAASTGAAPVTRRLPSKQSDVIPLQVDIANTLRTMGKADVDKTLKRIASEAAQTSQPPENDYSQPFLRPPVVEAPLKAPAAKAPRQKLPFDVDDPEHPRQQFQNATDRALQRLLCDVHFARGRGLEDNGDELSCKLLDGIYKFYKREGHMEDGLPEVKPEPPAPPHLRYDERSPPLPGSLRCSLIPDQPLPPKPKKKRKTVESLLRSRSTTLLTAAMGSVSNQGRLCRSSSVGAVAVEN